MGRQAVTYYSRMYTLQGRIACGVAGIILATFLVAMGVQWGWVFLATPLLLTWGYFRYGPLTLAFRAYHERDWPLLRKHLGAVHRPEWLNAQNSAYHILLSGVAAYKQGELSVARHLLGTVPTEHLRTDNMRSILECHRAEIALALDDPVAARQHLSRAKEIPHQPEVEAAVAELERRLPAA